MADSPGLLANVGMRLSRALDAVSAKGAIPGRIGADTAARSRWGFSDMTTNGPVEAIGRDFRGIVGGTLALVVGNVNWLARGMRNFEISVEYVYEKVQHGEVGPGADFPIRVSLGRVGSVIIRRYPETFVRALESGNRRAVVRAWFKEPGNVTTLFALYPVFTFLVLYSVGCFVAKALFDSPDAQKYALCELAIMESQLSNDAKDAALARLRKTAPKTIIEYAYYVPLLVPFDGTVQDKAYPRNASGDIIDNHSVIPSVFKQVAIHIAQSLRSEVIGLRSLLWLYGDEQLAREKNYRETIRSYGPEAAQRIAEHPRYPLRSEQVAELTQAGPRQPTAVADILDQMLRERGLAAVADDIKAACT